MYFATIKKKSRVNKYEPSTMLYASPHKNATDTKSLPLRSSQSEEARQELGKSQLRHHLSQEVFPDPPTLGLVSFRFSINSLCRYVS